MLAVMPASAQNDELAIKASIVDKAGTDVSAQHPKTESAPDIVDKPYSERIIYESINAKGEKIYLSAMVYIPSPWDVPDSDVLISHIILNCHPTVTSNYEAPTGAGAIDKDINRICGVHDSWDLYTDSYTMVVCPDYCGYGISSYEQHPYLIHDITAINCIDAVRAAIYLAAEKGRLSTKGYDTQIVGYSQGGATALACTKYLESDGCRQSLKDFINLRETVCGDGPYSAPATVGKYLEWGTPAEYGGEDRDLEYPCVLPLIVQAAKAAYDDGCMHTVEIEDFFSETFLSTGILDLLKTKVTNTNDLNNEIAKKMPRRRPVDVFSSNIINPDGTFNTTTNQYKCLMRALEMGDLTKGWEPQHPITFYHLPNDGVVPYANFEEAKKGFGTNKKHIRFIEAEDAHSASGLITWFDLICSMQGISDPDFENTNHADGGTLFYVDFLFGDQIRKKDWWK